MSTIKYDSMILMVGYKEKVEELYLKNFLMKSKEIKC